MNYKFEELKPKIMEALSIKFRQTPLLGESNGFVLIEGFAMQSIQPQTEGISIGGNAIPMVIVVGNTTGRVYQFALKALLPDVTL